MDKILDLLSRTVPQAQSLEQLTRPLLDMLGLLTGLESTYLTTVDLERGVQHVEYARNASSFQIPEGLDVPWGDTLCKRSLDEGRMYTADVPARWGDSEAARALGLQTYMSCPVRRHDGELLGTLCAASDQQHAMSESAEPALKLFAELIGTFMEREQLMQELRVANQRLADLALTDVLTALPNRRAAMAELARMLAQGRRDGTQVLVGIIDLDGFKAINDQHGHQAGDAMLQQSSRRIGAALREADMLGRLGGDEFLVLAPGQSGDADTLEAAAQALQLRVLGASVGRYELGDAVTLDYAGPSVGVVAVDPHATDADAAVRLADAEMYRVKAQRRALRN
jgi:diguanylate cyclase